MPFNQTLEELQSFTKGLYNQLEALKKQRDSADGADKTALEAKVNSKNQEVAEATAALLNAKPTTSSSTYETTVNNDSGLRNLNAKVDGVPKFKGDGPKGLTLFISELDQINELNVKTNAKLAEAFVDLVKGRLDNQVYQSMKTAQAEGTAMDTYADIKSWLHSTYDSKITAFQLLGECFNFSFEKADSYLSQAQKFENSLRAAKQQILANYRKNHGSEMTADQMLNLVGAQLLSEHIRKTDPKVFQSVLGIMEDFKSATDLANKADTMRDRLGAKTIAESSAFPANRYQGPKGQGRYDSRDNRRSHNNGNGGNRSNGNSNGNRYGGNRNGNGNNGNRDSRDKRDNRDNRSNRYPDNRNHSSNSGGNRYDNRDRNSNGNQNGNRNGNRYDNRDNRYDNRDNRRDNQGRNRDWNRNSNENQNRNRTYAAERQHSPARDRSRSRSPGQYSDRGYSPKMSHAGFRL